MSALFPSTPSLEAQLFLGALLLILVGWAWWEKRKVG